LVLDTPSLQLGGNEVSGEPFLKTQLWPLMQLSSPGNQLRQ
jgi:hypothetical protein